MSKKKGESCSNDVRYLLESNIELFSAENEKFELESSAASGWTMSLVVGFETSEAIRGQPAEGAWF